MALTTRQKEIWKNKVYEIMQDDIQTGFTYLDHNEAEKISIVQDHIDEQRQQLATSRSALNAQEAELDILDGETPDR